MNVEFMITDPKSGQNYFPAVQEGITWTTERRSNPRQAGIYHCTG